MSSLKLGKYLRQPENGLRFVVNSRLTLTMRLMPTGHLLFFASPKKSKQKKGDPDVQVWLRQTSLTAHPFFGACELAALRASSNKRTLFPEKRMLRSAGRRGRAAVLNVCGELGSLKVNLSSKKPHGRTPNGFAFSGCLCNAQRQPETLALQQRKRVGMAAIRHVLFQTAQPFPTTEAA